MLGPSPTFVGMAMIALAGADRRPPDPAAAAMTRTTQPRRQRRRASPYPARGAVRPCRHAGLSVLIAGSLLAGARVANLIDPVAITALRFVLASVAVGVFSASRDRVCCALRLCRAVALSVLGGLYAIYFVLMFEGLKTALPVPAAAVFALTPLDGGGFPAGWSCARSPARTWRWRWPRAARARFGDLSRRHGGAGTDGVPGGARRSIWPAARRMGFIRRWCGG